MKAPIDVDAVIDAIEQDDNLGFCLHCGAQAYGCEPDARNYTCDECGADQVFGAEEVLMMGAC